HSYHLAKAVSFFPFLQKRYRTLLFFSDGYARRRHRRTFRSTDISIFLASLSQKCINLLRLHP
ncbi:MAG: hypothetical protein KME22_13265, partial [Hassallia sp. WJT32-NPBG1]|nr:hypothetical protein [Hassallia sp. WJT32-NPBG1]